MFGQAVRTIEFQCSMPAVARQRRYKRGRCWLTGASKRGISRTLEAFRVLEIRTLAGLGGCYRTPKLSRYLRRYSQTTSITEFPQWYTRYSRCYDFQQLITNLKS